MNEIVSVKFIVERSWYIYVKILRNYDMNHFVDSQVFMWIILPIMIFLLRMVDVSIGTLRIVFIARGTKFIAPILGFFEILIWLIAIRQIFNNLNNIACYLAYAGGFATGNFVGIYLEKKLALGYEVVRIITRSNADNLIKSIKKAGFGITTIDGEGATGLVKIIFTIIKRKNLPEIIELINKHNPKAFYTRERIQMANEGIYPLPALSRNQFHLNLLKMDRKKK
jgi:uncharacterized protein YebE (UPF0316 family)